MASNQPYEIDFVIAPMASKLRAAVAWWALSIFAGSVPDDHHDIVVRVALTPVETASRRDET